MFYVVLSSIKFNFQDLLLYYLFLKQLVIEKSVICNDKKTTTGGNTIEINHGLLKNHHIFKKKHISMKVYCKRRKGKGTYTIAFMYIIGNIENCITRK